ncbi:methyl-accepting chemotaxis protein [Aliivibrio wodanis]|uniref:methyl-accepting chemotaxis protein n=1 Tax=Aliivibrio wodanis TaxID=80852 RepID=UPI00406C0250
MKTITAKILTSLIVIMIVIASLVTVTIQYQNSTLLHDEYASHKADLKEQMQVILQEPVFVYDSAVSQSIINSFQNDSIVTAIKVVDQRGKVLAQFSSNKKSDETQTVDLMWEGKKIGSVEMSFTTQPISDGLTQSFNQTLFVVLLFTLLSMIAVIVLLKKLVLTPLNEVKDVLADIAGGGGDLTARIPVKNEDEIGQLSGSFNAFIHTIQFIIKDMSAAATTLKEVSSTVADIKDKTLVSTNTQMDLTSSSVANIEQLDIATQEIANSTESTLFKATQACQVTEDSRQYIKANIDNINALVNNLESTADEVSSLKDSSDNIGSVLDVIKGIAEQTNLLALNAAIEAARAGESGRGFAVVADEVRALASKTHDSTREIESIITQLQSQAESSFQATQTSKSMVSETIAKSEQTGEALEQISQEITSINDMIMVISSACEEQSNVTANVSSDMNHLHNGANELEKDSKELEQSIENLLEVGNTMVGQIERFKY